MKAKKTKKKILISVISLVLAAAIGAGIWFFTQRGPKEPVYVYPFNMLGMTEYWGDNQESYGPVSSDRIQTIFLSETQTVTEILVEQGQEVKKGDLLMTFDTTLSDLALERKRLEMEKKKLDLEDAKTELQRLRNLRPMVIPQTKPDSGDDEDLGPQLTDRYQISENKAYDGSSQELALICWLNSSASVEDGLFEAIRQAAEQYQNENAGTVSPSSASAPAGEPEAPASEETEPSADATEPSSGETEPGEGTDPTDPPEPFTVNRYHVVFKVTASNRALGAKNTWQGLVVTRKDGGYSFQFESPVIPDHMLEGLEGEEEDAPEIDYGSGYTYTQLTQMRAEQEKKIAALELEVKMAEANYRLLELETSDGKVYAKLDGVIVSLMDPEEAKMTQQPVLKLSDGGGFYIECFVSELEKDKLVVGQEVTVNDWNTGMEYTGTIETLGDFPNPDGYFNGMGNPNATYYPFLVFVDGSADLQEGRYVSVMYSAGSAQNGIYLQNPFLRTEQGRSFVFVQGADGLLEKRYVTTGKGLWGSYTEILEGLTESDLIAFPYGKDVREGVPTQEGDHSTLYE